MIKTSLIFGILFFYISDVFCKNDTSDFRSEDKIRIREAQNIFNEYGNKLWENWSSAPFAILLVTNENEYLINHPNPSDDFTYIEYDSIVGSNIYVRPRQFSNNLLATFPAVNGISTIVVGLPENTSRPSLDWVITLLHEHFHQFQSTQPDYYSSVDSLDLAGDDKTGMWMLNYNFPYNDEKISSWYKVLTQSAKKAFLSINKPDFEENVKNYLAERENFKSMLNKKDYDYFSFQIWQEGLARFTEIEIAEILKDKYMPSNELILLNDYISLDSFYVRVIDRLLKKADTQVLSENERNCFYTLGALEGLILNKVNPGWKDLYFKEKFYVEKYY